jgi:hypothetical protein
VTHCATDKDCAQAHPACPIQPAGYELYQQEKLCLIEGPRAASAPRRRGLRGGAPGGICVCAVPKFDCAADGPQAQDPVEEVQMYMLHPPGGEFNLSSHDTGDLMGDAWFACADPSATKFGDTLFTKTIVAVNTSFGPFARCTDLVPPPIPCDTSLLGGDGASVGRGLPQFENPIDVQKVGRGFTGQCANNSLGGSWYSMPAKGRCADGGPALVGKDPPGCSWSVVRRVKTISWGCLDKLGFNSSGCARGPVVVDPVTGLRGYPAAAKIAAEGFATCRDIVGQGRPQ